MPFIRHLVYLLTTYKELMASTLDAKGTEYNFQIFENHVSILLISMIFWRNIPILSKALSVSCLPKISQIFVALWNLQYSIKFSHTSFCLITLLLILFTESWPSVPFIRHLVHLLTNHKELMASTLDA